MRDFIRRNLSPLACLLAAALSLDLFHKLRTADHTVEYSVIASRLQLSGNHAAAADYFQRIVDLAPDNHVAWNGLAMSLRETGDLADAIEAHDRSIDLLPYHADYHIQRSDTLAKAQRYEEALDALETLVERGYFRTDRPDELPVRMIAIYRVLERLPEAVAYLDREVAARPGIVELLALRGDLQGQLGAWEKAVDDLAAAAALEPKNETVARSLIDARGELTARSGSRARVR